MANRKRARIEGRMYEVESRIDPNIVIARFEDAVTEAWQHEDRPLEDVATDVERAMRDADVRITFLT